MEQSAHPEVTVILKRLGTGDQDAARELLPILYHELRRLAESAFRGQRKNHTLQPTVLVHEAFIKLVGKPTSEYNDRKHFIRVAATAMRQILINHARMHATDKRGGGETRIEFNEELISGKSQNDTLDVLALNEAMEKLAQMDARKHQVVELRFFGGLTMPEIAEVLGASLTTVEADWRAARAWLKVNMGESESP